MRVVLARTLHCSRRQSFKAETPVSDFRVNKLVKIIAQVHGQWDKSMTEQIKRFQDR
jgi:hypothetical protein